MSAKSKKHDGPWGKERAKESWSTERRRKAMEEAEKRKQALEARAREANYEGDAPRCESCKAFRKAGTILINSLPTPVKAKCMKHGFLVKAQGCCDSWQGIEGDSLIIGG